VAGRNRFFSFFYGYIIAGFPAKCKSFITLFSHNKDKFKGYSGGYARVVYIGKKLTISFL
jgi:hypothetical protein